MRIKRLLLTFIIVVVVIISALGILDIAKDKSIKILCIGNSFNQDTMAYLPRILSEVLPDVAFTYGTCYTGSAEIKDHINWFYENKVYTVFNYYDQPYDYWRRYTGRKARTLSQILEKQDWDIITIQGNSADVLTESDVNAMIADAKNLKTILKSNTRKSFDLVWFEWVSRPMGELSDSEMYDLIQSASLKAAKELKIKTVIPVGSAFQNARQVPILAELGDSPQGNLLYSDNIHMQAGIPSLLAAYTTAAAILDKLGYDPELIMNSTWVPTDENVKQLRATRGNGGGMTHGYLTGITDENIYSIKLIAINTVKNNNYN